MNEAARPKNIELLGCANTKLQFYAAMGVAIAVPCDISMGESEQT